MTDFYNLKERIITKYDQIVCKSIDGYFQNSLKNKYPLAYAFL